MTLTEISADVYRRMNFDSSPDSTVSTRITAFVNKWHRMILSRPGLTRLRQDTYSLTSVNGTAQYGLPPIIGQVHRITQPSNQITLREESKDWLRTIDPGLVVTGAPAIRFVLTGQQEVEKQPSAAAELFVISTSASDTNTAYLECYRAGGYHVALSATMTGVTGKTFVIDDILEVTKFYLSAVAVGTVTLRQTSGAGTELARIPLTARYAKYQGIRFWPTPTGEAYTIDFTRNIIDLANATDEPLLPADFHWLLSSGAEYEELRKRDDSRARDVRAELEVGMRDLNAYVNNPPSYRPSTLPQKSGISNLGAWYPSGTF